MLVPSIETVIRAIGKSNADDDVTGNPHDNPDRPKQGSADHVRRAAQTGASDKTRQTSRAGRALQTGGVDQRGP
ncbi:hypothetical protein GCM10010467_18810 [Actinocorallia glomerata]|uniref:Uncharacterized protein n=2 Tax=Actinomycetes TaxID=1760 RepID=A0ABP6LYS9_9MICC